uniref:Uncharacterized protein n=1 Tax=Lepeophtheirus salmonis TaxID=72036 RepID=A0A0K2T6P1_LEPSM
MLPHRLGRISGDRCVCVLNYPDFTASTAVWRPLKVLTCSHHAFYLVKKNPGAPHNLHNLLSTHMGLEQIRHLCHFVSRLTTVDF